MAKVGLSFPVRFALVIAAFVMMFAMPVPSRAQSDGSANEYLDNCQEVLKDPIQNAFNAGLCLGFLEVWDNASIGFAVLWGPGDSQLQLPYCMPEGVTLGQTARIWVRYLENHPDKLHLRAGVTLLLALMEAFPCQ